MARTRSPQKLTQAELLRECETRPRRIPPGPGSHNFLKVLSDLVELGQRGLPLCRSSSAKTVSKVSVVSDKAGKAERGTPIHRS